MPKDQLPAAGTGLPNFKISFQRRRSPLMGRRHFLRGAVAAGAATVAHRSSASGQQAVDTSLAELESLIAKHDHAWQIDCNHWERVPNVDFPRPAVEIGRLLTKIDRTGNGRHESEPIMAYSRAEILDSHENVLASDLRFHGGSPARDAAVRANAERRLAQQLAQFEARQAEVKRLKDETGYTAAVQRAEAADDQRYAIKRDLLAFVPGSTAAAARLAKWVVDFSEKDRGYFDEGDLTEVLASIART